MELDDWLSPLLDADGMRAADAWAIEDRQIPSLTLMERAGTAVADAAERLLSAGPVRVVCGKGNNGGDGIVAARVLFDRGLEVELLLLWPVEELSSDSRSNLDRYTGSIRRPDPDSVAPMLAGSGVIIDAIFGTGFSGAPREPAASAIEAINEAGATVVACDIPSGIDASSGEGEGVAVAATETLSFHALKVGHRIAPGKWCSGVVSVIDIGIPDDAPGEPAAGVLETSVLGRAPRRGAESNKFSSGNVLVVGGSRGMTGAVSMASLAAIRAGAGYAAVAAPASLEPILEVKLTEVMTLGVAEVDGSLAPEAAERILDRAESAACVVVGPGLGRERGAAELARGLCESVEAPLLVDADGLGALGADLELLARREAPTIITPHAGELGRLLDRDSGEVSARRLSCARTAADRSGAIVVLKGDDTIVADAERIAVNAVASPGLATAGSGDVLSGTIAALVARGMDPFAAACAGVIAHARAGVRAAERVGVESVIATDVIGALPAGLTS